MDDEKLTPEEFAVIEDGTFKKRKNGIIITLVAVVMVAFGVIIALNAKSIMGVVNPFRADNIDITEESDDESANKGLIFNPYNREYANTTGRTIADIAEEHGYTLEELKELLGLPENMPGNTYENAANMSVKIKTFIEKSGLTMDKCREYYGWGDDITEETTLGEAIDKTTLLAYCGGEQQVFANFKEHYGLGDEITEDTLYGDVRKTVEEKEIEIRERKEKEEVEATATPEAETAE